MGATAAVIFAALGLVGLHPFTTDENNQSCAPWHDPSGITTRDCDPVNVVFPNQTIAQVHSRLALAGWTVVVDGAIQRLHWGDPMNWAAPDLQLEADVNGTDRYHVRLWQVGPDVVGDAHHDGGRPHVVDQPWEVAEAYLATRLCSSWCGHLPLPAQLAIQGGAPTWRGLANDGVATVIPSSPPKKHKPAQAIAART